MMFRPRPCRWFELIAARDDVASVLETLARSGAVELQTHERRAGPLIVVGAGQLLERFHELAKTYRTHWGEPGGGPPGRFVDPAAQLAERVAQVEAWRADADALITELERLASQRRTLSDLARLLRAGGARLPRPELLAGAGRYLVDARIYAVAEPPEATELPAGVLPLVVVDPEGGAFVVAVGRRDDLALLDERFTARGARRVVWPDDLRGDFAQAARQVVERRATLEQRQRQLQHALDELAQRHDLSNALADIARVEWLIRHGSEVSASDRLLWVTGWTTARDTSALCAPLQQQGLRCVVRFTEPPAKTEPPSLLVNPPAIRAFETFARLLGQPGRDEADPSAAVALIAPLLFGFMFGDVAHGLVLCVAGWLLRKRAPMLLMLVPGGIAATVFGLLFGSVFAREDLIPALWLHPLREPVTLLMVSIGIGAAVLLGGLLLNALQAHWRRQDRPWWAREAGLLLAYVGLLAAPWQGASLWLALAGALWFAVGSAATAAAARVAAFGAGLAEFTEKTLQLLVNTVSFARVGAFALAHAGLAAAVVGVAETSGAIGYWLVLLLGNVLIVVLEGLVVGIQTTRLLLFEFFVRFLVGTGRAFRPLPPPFVTVTAEPRSST